MTLIELRIGREEFNNAFGVIVTLLGFGVHLYRRRIVRGIWSTWTLALKMEWRGGWYWDSTFLRKIP